MSLTMYQASVPVFVRSMTNLQAILDKGAKFAEAKKVEPSVLINARLAPDMFPLSRQVQAVSDSAKGAGARLAGIEVPSMPDTETTFPELQARLQKTIDFLNTIKPEQIDGSEDRAIVLKMRTREAHFKGRQYLFDFVYPNFFFHVTTAYAILRHNGADVGKMDFLGSIGS